MVSHRDAQAVCVWLRHRLGPRRGHAIAGMRRFIDSMGQGDDEKDRVERSTARQTEWLAEEVESADQSKADTKNPERDQTKEGGDDYMEVVEQRPRMVLRTYPRLTIMLVIVRPVITWKTRMTLEMAVTTNRPQLMTIVV